MQLNARSKIGRWLVGSFFTGGLLFLIALATSTFSVVLAFFVASVVVATFGVFAFLFPGSRFFAIALSNFLAVYACFFLFFVETNFYAVSLWAVHIGFVLPISGFLAGVVWRRAVIQQLVSAPRLRGEISLGRAAWWVLPITVIGWLTFAVPGLDLGMWPINLLFLAAMATIGSIALLVSREITIFLLDAGLLFEEFFTRMRGLVLPAFAFLTFYSLFVIFFAGLYSVLDRYTDANHFVIDGTAKPITFGESLYFSVITLSTVGYGDIVATSNLVRLIISIQIVCGVVLLLFGFNEIFQYAQRHRRRDDER